MILIMIASHTYPRFMLALKFGFDVEFHIEKTKNNTNGNNKLALCLVNNMFDNNIKNKNTNVVLTDVAVAQALNLEYQFDLICKSDLDDLSAIK